MRRSITARRAPSVATACAAALCASACATVAPAPPPDGFVRLAEVDPTIRQDIRYHGRENFLGRPVAGYERPVCILTRPAAEALKRVQARARARGQSLVVFDCYRPARAVADFMAWAAEPGPDDPQWRPGLAKDRLVPNGYVAARSGHSRGSTVDLALVRLRPTAGDRAPRVSACAREDRNTMDFGTPFDCFHPSSATASTAVSADAQANRRLLLSDMQAEGFRNYAAEWWHFTLIDEPNRTVFHDFVVR